jgi:hypothetical protein
VSTPTIFAVIGVVMLVALVRAAGPEESVPVGTRPDGDRAEPQPVFERARERDRRTWDRLLSRADRSPGWQRWHRVAAGLWVGGTAWLVVAALGAALDGSWLAVVWALLAVVWLNLSLRAVALVRREPAPPDPFWPLRLGTPK